MPNSHRHRIPLFASAAAFAAILTTSHLASALTAAACDPRSKTDKGPCFGLELTFGGAGKTYGKDIASAGPEQQATAKSWYEKVAARCGQPSSNASFECQVISGGTACPAKRTDSAKLVDMQPGFRVCIFAPEWDKPWFYQVGYDNSVLEIATQPANEDWLQELFRIGALDHIWTMAEGIGLAPQESAGGGHIHIDLETAFRSPRHLLNTMTTLQNVGLMPLLPSMIALALNAPPLAMDGPIVRDRYRKFITNHWSDKEIFADNGVFKTIHKEVYIRTYHDVFKPGADPQSGDSYQVISGNGKTYVSGFDTSGKYQMINLHSNHKTLELRSIGPQRAPVDVLILVKLFAKVIAGVGEDKVELLADDQLPLRATDADVERVWQTDDAVAKDKIKRFRTDSKLESSDAAMIADRWAKLVLKADGSLVCPLVRYMPPEIGELVRDAHCKAPQAQLND